jgi:hypothetical protein
MYMLTYTGFLILVIAMRLLDTKNHHITLCTSMA